MNLLYCTPAGRSGAGTGRFGTVRARCKIRTPYCITKEISLKNYEFVILYPCRTVRSGYGTVRDGCSVLSLFIF